VEACLGRMYEMMEVVLGENGEGEEWLKRVESLRNADYE